MEIAAIVLSAVAVIISVVVPIYQDKAEKKLNRIELKAIYHQDIYKNYLIKEIPVARRYLTFDNDGRLANIDKLCSCLRGITFDSLYFLYAAPSYYHMLQEKCGMLEDYLVECSQKPHSKEITKQIENEIQIKIKEIYDIIEDKYVKG